MISVGWKAVGKPGVRHQAEVGGGGEAVKMLDAVNKRCLWGL